VEGAFPVPVARADSVSQGTCNKLRHDATVAVNERVNVMMNSIAPVRRALRAHCARASCGLTARACQGDFFGDTSLVARDEKPFPYSMQATTSVKARTLAAHNAAVRTRDGDDNTHVRHAAAAVPRRQDVQEHEANGVAGPYAAKGTLSRPRRSQLVCSSHHSPRTQFSARYETEHAGMMPRMRTSEVVRLTQPPPSIITATARSLETLTP
jgi:hypothetical protein